MGNSIGRGKKAKVMEIDGETFKLKTPATASDVVKDYPGHVLLDSEAVKHFGIRAKPLESEQLLKPKKTYFLVELPKFPQEKLEPKITARRVRSSGIQQLNAKERLEFLMLSKRSVSDLSAVTPADHRNNLGPVDGPNSGPIRVKIRLPKSQVEKLMEESKDDVEVADKFVELFMENSGDRRHVQWKPELGNIGENLKLPKKRVSFVPNNGEIQLCVDSH